MADSVEKLSDLPVYYDFLDTVLLGEVSAVLVSASVAQFACKCIQMKASRETTSFAGSCVLEYRCL